MKHFIFLQILFLLIISIFQIIPVSTTASSLPQKKEKRMRVYITSINASPSGFTTFLSANKKSSLIEHLTKKNINLANSYELIEKLKIAKKYEINGENKLAYEKYLEISNLRLTLHWPKPQRKIITYSLLKLSELNIKQQEFWIKNTFAFGSVDEAIWKYFKNGTKRTFRNIKGKLKFKTLIPPPEFYQYDKIWINGKEVNLSELKKYNFIENKQYKVSLYSNTYLPENIQINFRQMQSYITAPQAMLSGDCNNYTLNHEAKDNIHLKNLSVFAFESDQCIQPVQANIFKITNIPNKDESFFQKEVQGIKSGNSVNSNKFKPKSILKNKWLWISVSALLSYKIYEHNRNINKSSKGPLSSANNPAATPEPQPKNHDKEIEDI